MDKPYPVEINMALASGLLTEAEADALPLRWAQKAIQERAAKRLQDQGKLKATNLGRAAGRLLGILTLVLMVSLMVLAIVSVVTFTVGLIAG